MTPPPSASTGNAQTGPDAGVEVDVDVVESWSLLVRYHRMAVNEMDHGLRERCGYSLDHYDVLHQINEHDGPIRMGDLAARLLVANSSCNRIVGRLVDDGHVARVKGEHDRREVFVALTAAGKRLRRRMAVIHTRDIRRLFGERLSDDQHRSLLLTLQALIGSDP